MEGSAQRFFHRTEEDCPVAVRNGDRLDRISHGFGNLSVGGMFAAVSELPIGSHVSVEVGGKHPFHAEGVVRYVAPARGIGIEFTSLEPVDETLIADHIADLTIRGLPAA
ncbi:MAG: PilZ domain-containing protein [Candidatus Acidiferrales bacterium]